MDKGNDQQGEEEKETFNKRIYSLLQLYAQLFQLLEVFFAHGLLIIVTDEINRYYLRLCIRIQSILEKPGFENLAQQNWQYFDNLRSLCPDAPGADWEYGGRQETANFLSKIEELFISSGEKEYPLEPSDEQLLSDIQIYLDQYRRMKGKEGDHFLNKIIEGKKTFKEFGLPFSGESQERNQTSPIISEIQEEEYRKFEYKCRDQVYVPGAIPMRRSNLIEINEHKVKIGDHLFRLFLRLVSELMQREGGWVHRETLAAEGIITDKEIRFQKFSELRGKIEGSLLDKDGQKFLENDGSGQYRISTHPDFIKYDKSKLLTHPDHQIVKIAEKLP